MSPGPSTAPERRSFARSRGAEFRRVWRRRAWTLAARGQIDAAIVVQQAVVSREKKAEAQSALRDRLRLLRWQMAAGRWRDALEQTEILYARSLRRGSVGADLAGVLCLCRAVSHLALGWGGRFRRSLASLLVVARKRGDSRTRGAVRRARLERAALTLAVHYESARRGESSRVVTLLLARSRRSDRSVVADAPSTSPSAAAPALAIDSLGSYTRQLFGDGATPGDPAVLARSLRWDRLPELLTGPWDWADASAASGDALFDDTQTEAPPRTPEEIDPLVERWVSWSEESPNAGAPVWALPALAERAARIAPDVAPGFRARLHRTLMRTSARVEEPLARARVLEALSEVSLWLAGEPGSDRSLDLRERRSAAWVAQARADLGLAAGLWRRLGLERRAESCEERWSRLAWPAQAGGRSGDAISGAVLRTPSDRGGGQPIDLATLRRRLYEIGFVTSDERLLRQLAPLFLLASTPLPVLILGESGTGKEVLARALHRWSRLEGDFVPIHCGAIPRDLLESELFGHTRGAFTGALAEKTGLVEAADGGTLFLDEIGEMGAEAQMKMLRVLESGEVRRVGDLRSRIARIRLVAATHRDLEGAVARGEFRLDLLHRIRGVVVHLTALRERKADIPELAARFVRELGAGTSAGTSLHLTDRALARLLSHEWPGNVRELRAVLARAALLARATGRARIDAELLGLRHGGGEDAVIVAAQPGRSGDSLLLPDAFVDQVVSGATGANGLDRVLDDVERRLIMRALRENSGNRSRAALSLGGLSRTTLLSKMKRLGIEAAASNEAGASIEAEAPD